MCFQKFRGLHKDFKRKLEHLPGRTISLTRPFLSEDKQMLFLITILYKQVTMQSPIWTLSLA